MHVYLRLEYFQVFNGVIFTVIVLSIRVFLLHLMFITCLLHVKFILHHMSYIPMSAFKYAWFVY